MQEVVFLSSEFSEHSSVSFIGPDAYFMQALKKYSSSLFISYVNFFPKHFFGILKHKEIVQGVTIRLHLDFTIIKNGLYSDKLIF